MPKQALLFELSGLLFIVISLPLIAKRVRPNRWYGFRVKKTLSDERIWYQANFIAGRDLLLAGIAISASTAIVCLFGQNSAEFPVDAITLTIFVAATTMSVAHSFWSLKNMS